MEKRIYKYLNLLSNNTKKILLSGHDQHDSFIFTNKKELEHNLKNFTNLYSVLISLIIEYYSHTTIEILFKIHYYRDIDLKSSHPYVNIRLKSKRKTIMQSYVDININKNTNKNYSLYFSNGHIKYDNLYVIEDGGPVKTYSYQCYDYNYDYNNSEKCVCPLITENHHSMLSIDNYFNTYLNYLNDLNDLNNLNLNHYDQITTYTWIKRNSYYDTKYKSFIFRTSQYGLLSKILKTNSYLLPIINIIIETYNITKNDYYHYIVVDTNSLPYKLCVTNTILNSLDEIINDLDCIKKIRKKIADFIKNQTKTRIN